MLICGYKRRPARYPYFQVDSDRELATEEKERLYDLENELGLSISELCDVSVAIVGNRVECTLTEVFEVDGVTVEWPYPPIVGTSVSDSVFAAIEEVRSILA